MANKSKTINLEAKLPFDQFSRQKIVAYLIDEGLRKNNKKFSIIDLGGYRGKTVEFQPKDSVTILDVFINGFVGKKGYIKGDATETGLPNNSFDVACSFDVFEHVPRSRRQMFIEESLRVSKLGAFMAIPIDVDGKVANAEVEMNDFYINLTGFDHKWLKEHIDYKIPKENEVEDLVKAAGAQMVSVVTNRIGDWSLMQMLLFMSSQIPDIIGDVSMINEWYNHNSLPLDSNIDVGYRKIFFISKNKKNIESVRRAIEKLDQMSKDDELITVNQKTFTQFSDTLSKVGKKFITLNEIYRDNIGKTERELIQRNELLKKKLQEEKQTASILDKELKAINESIAWKIVKKVRSMFRFFVRPSFKEDK